MNLIKTDKKIGDLLIGDTVVIVHTGGYYKGGHTTKVEYDLADFMDDSPPFIEISFIDDNDDIMYFTSNLSEPVYELDGLLFVQGKNNE